MNGVSSSTFVIILVAILILSFALLSDSSVSLSPLKPSGWFNPQNTSGENASVEPADRELNATQVEPYNCIQVRTPQDLDNVRNNLAGHYCQMNDIDLSGYTNWEPIADSSNPFRGSYNGNGYTIKNLRALHPQKEYSTGLFGYLWSSKVENLHLVNFTIEGKHNVGSLSGNALDTILNNISCDICLIKGISAIGGIVGYASGGFGEYDLTLIKNSFVTNSTIFLNFTPTMESSPTEAGGLVGMAFDAIITDSFADTFVNGSIEGDGVGGLVGLLGYVSIINRGFSTGHVFGENYVGGLVGYNYGAINQSYSFTNVSADTTESTTLGGVGGLVGNNAGNVTFSYSRGKVFTRLGYPCSTSQCLGGLIGRNNFVNLPTYVYSSYWDINTSGQTTSAGGTGKTTAQMKTQSTFVGWDFNNVWKIASNEYPKLKWQN